MPTTHDTTMPVPFEAMLFTDELEPVQRVVVTGPDDDDMVKIIRQNDDGSISCYSVLPENLILPEHGPRANEIIRQMAELQRELDAIPQAPPPTPNPDVKILELAIYSIRQLTEPGPALGAECQEGNGEGE